MTKAKPAAQGQVQPEPVPDRARQARIQRAAQRRGLKASRIVVRDPGALRYNRWELTYPGGELVISHVVRGIETGASTAELEEFLGIAGQVTRPRS